jgi:hypothetical protein
MNEQDVLAIMAAIIYAGQREPHNAEVAAAEAAGLLTAVIKAYKRIPIR